MTASLQHLLMKPSKLARADFKASSRLSAANPPPAEAAAPASPAAYRLLVALLLALTELVLLLALTELVLLLEL